VPATRDKARAVQFSAPRRVELVEIELLEPAEGQVLVRTQRSGISSGSELLAFRGEIDPTLALDERLDALGGTFAFPFRYGYACVGRVETSQAPEVEEGSLVFAFHPHQDRFVAAGADVVVLDRVAARQATLFPFVETALQVTLDAGPVAHEPVVVLGLGVLGILVSLLLERTGARVVAAEPRPFRRELATGLGVRAVEPAQLSAIVREDTGGYGVPLVVEASGSPTALAPALGLLAHEGTALVASWYGTNPVALPLGAAFHRRRLTIRSTQVSSIPAAQTAVWSLARRRAVARSLMPEVPLAELATHELPVERVQDAFELLDGGAPEALHVALCYD
jgi:2-desacetyl-2-hydroxyethyl bacteriochlorophyllide A dehydrogenase